MRHPAPLIAAGFALCLAAVVLATSPGGASSPTLSVVACHLPLFWLIALPYAYWERKAVRAGALLSASALVASATMMARAWL